MREDKTKFYPETRAPSLNRQSFLWVAFGCHRRLGLPPMYWKQQGYICL